MLKKFLFVFAGLLVVLVAGGLIAARVIGIWHLIFPSHYHESTPPEIPQALAQPAVLVFSKTNAFRHIEGIAAGNAFLKTLAVEKGWGMFETENSAVFNPADLDKFAVVVFNSVTGDALSDAQEQAFQQWLEAGGGWLGIHGAGDGSHADWPWYVETLIGAVFTAHTMGPQFQAATVMVEDSSHAVTRSLPATWTHTEEWYSWDQSVRGKGFDVLLSVDENSYDPRFILFGQKRDLRMGDHPVAWSRRVGNGKALYSAMGHSAEAFESREHQMLLEEALEWLMP